MEMFASLDLVSKMILLAANNSEAGKRLSVKNILPSSLRADSDANNAKNFPSHFNFSRESLHAG